MSERNGGSAAGEPDKASGGRGGKKSRKPRSRKRRYARRALYGLATMIALPVVAFAILYLLTPIPSSQQALAKAQGPVFYYADGTSVIARTGLDRRPVPIGRVPEYVRQAVISAENRSFYSDPGVSVKGTTRAVWATLTGGTTQGGSTITQQMVRNYYSGLSQERTVSRKLKEIMIALKVGREKSKDWILQQYLNTIYFGRNAYGIEAAARAYYHKDVGKLSVAEGAYLASAIQLPSYFADPYGEFRDHAERRWRYVINGMVGMGAISERDAARMRFPLPKKQKQKDIMGGGRGYVISEAKAELKRMGYTEDQINKGGLKVVTTLDKGLMRSARTAVESNVPDGTPKRTQTGLVAIDPSNGGIVAFYGGHDFLKRQFDNAFDARAQAGSGFKPYVLAAALSNGRSLDTYVDGSSPQTFDGTAVHNDSGESFGMVDLVTATQYSINTAYVNLGQRIGLDKVVAMAEKVGIPNDQLAPHAHAATLPLGVADVSVEQQAAGYATFAAEGVYHEPHLIKSVTDRDGNVRKVHKSGNRAFSRTVARDATYAMTKVIDAGTGTAASLPDRDAAGKTGTTEEGRALWFNGFVPQLAASVGMFRTDHKPLDIPGYAAYGGRLPARIWRSFMVDATRNMPVKDFGEPSIRAGGGWGLGGDGGEPTTGPPPDDGGPTTEPPDDGPTTEPPDDGGPTTEPPDDGPTTEPPDDGDEPTVGPTPRVDSD